jgi:hypothetical protein
MSDEEKLPRKNTHTENLIPMSKRTLRERQEISRKGGKASAEARAEKKKLKTIAKLALDTALSHEEKEYLKVAGFKPNQVLTKGGLAIITALRSAIKHGDISKLETIAKIAGEFEESVTVNSNDRKVFQFVPSDMPLPERPDIPDIPEEETKLP